MHISLTSLACCLPPIFPTHPILGKTSYLICSLWQWLLSAGDRDRVPSAPCWWMPWQGLCWRGREVTAHGRQAAGSTDMQPALQQETK